MNLLVLDQFSEMGGAQQALAELLPAMTARGWTGTVAMPGNGELFQRARAAGFATAQIPCGPYRSGTKSVADAARFAVDTARIAAQVRSVARGADLIYVNGPRVLPGVALAGLPLPVVYHAHSLIPGGTVRWLARAAAERTKARVIATCEFVASPWRGVRPVRVIYNGVAGPQSPLWKPGGMRIGCIGRIAPEKGQREFVQAARAILRECASATFVIYGASLFGDTTYEAQVRADAAGLPMDFAGWTRDVYQALAAIDLLFVPSAGHEATTRVILEAFAAGVPVVAFRSGGIPEVVEHGVTGVLVSSAAEMARAAVDALRSSALPAMSQAARHVWQQRFTQRRYHDEVLDALATLP
jgi:glycosyltransferase involved in cell wall biosynthesis